MNIIILGPQGSGKGTQAMLLAKNLNLFYFDMGSFLRKESENNPTLDRIVNKEGSLVPEEISTPLALDYIASKVPERDNIILDGIPRSLKQDELLREWFKEKGMKVDSAIFLDIPEETSVKRLSARRTCKACGRIYNIITEPPPTPETCECGGELYRREDDYPEAINKRLSVYKKSTQPIVNKYESEGILIRVDGEMPIGEIYNQIILKLNNNEKKSDRSQN